MTRKILAEAIRSRKYIEIELRRQPQRFRSRVVRNRKWALEHPAQALGIIDGDKP